MLKLYNSLSREKEEFKPLKNDFVRIYDCGPTVYDYDHIGHMWRYMMSDLTRRVLKYCGYKVKQVMNITDVGHLVSDGDEGEDKMIKGARKLGKDPWEIAEFFTDIFFTNRRKLNMLKPHIICRATDYIKEQIKMVESLIKKGYAYEISDGIYFDVVKFKD